MSAPRPGLLGRALRGRRTTLLFFALPALAVVSQALAWINYGVNVPWMDEWVPYLKGREGSLALEYLFEAFAYGISPIGRGLDSLAFRLFTGNIIVYELVSMFAMLGVLLVLQWKLLRLGLRHSVIVGVVFLTTLVMLRPGTYWGTVYHAYHHGIPLACVLVAIWITLSHGRLTKLRLALIAGLGFIAGMTLLTGSLAAMATGITFVAIGIVAADNDRGRLVRAGAALLAAGVVTLVIQFVSMKLGGSDAGSLTWPWTTQYWAYVTGLVGGSLWLVQNPTGLLRSVAVVTAVLGSVAVVLCVLYSAYELYRNRPVRIRSNVVPIVMLALAAAVTVYVGMAAAGRTYYGVAPGASHVDILISATDAHRPFWVVVLWPWVAAVGVRAIRRRSRHARAEPRLRRALPFWGAAAISLSIVGGSAALGTFNYSGYYQGIHGLRQPVYECLSNSLNLGLPLICQADQPGWDLTVPVLRAMSNDVSFTRQLRFAPSPVDDPALYRLAEAESSSFSLQRATLTQRLSTGGLDLRATNGAELTLTTGSAAELGSCRVAEVMAKVQPTARIAVRAFWASGRTPTITHQSAWKTVSPSWTNSQTMWFYVVELDGMADWLGLYMSGADQQLVIEDVVVRCRYR